MFGEEWALMLFTLLTQLAVGAFIILIVVRSILAKKADPKMAAQITDFGITAIGPVMAVSLLVSLFHLGSPLIAFRSLGNLRTSWLSREIFFSGLFFFLWLGQYCLSKKQDVGQGIRLITSLAGLLAIISMAGIYGASIKPAWADVNTLITFLGTTFFLGSIGVTASVAYVLRGKEISGDVLSLLHKTSLVALIALAVQLIYLPVYFTGLASGGPAAQASAQLLSGAYAFPTMLRWILSIAGGTVVLCTLHKVGKKANIIPVNMVYVGLAIALLGEVIGRYIFYVSAVSIMVG